MFPAPQFTDATVALPEPSGTRNAEGRAEPDVTPGSRHGFARPDFAETAASRGTHGCSVYGYYQAERGAMWSSGRLRRARVRASADTPIGRR